MSRFKTGDTARLNFRKSKEGRYAENGRLENGRLAKCVEYLGDGMWRVKAVETGKLRKWFTADMDNVTGLIEHKEIVEQIKQLVGA